MAAVPFAVLTHHLPRDGNSRYQRVEGESQGCQARVAAHRGVDELSLVLLGLGDESPGRSGELPDGQRGHAATVNERRHLDNVVREGSTGTTGRLNDRSVTIAEVLRQAGYFTGLSLIHI